ncbi:MAG TPA: acyl-CoA dehydrogenase family protein [Streptosporangiaceae bacterium]|nr:acyl-CoA dehydrogenase family protein [Streptosporangiaceae bacterium]
MHPGDVGGGAARAVRPGAAATGICSWCSTRADSFKGQIVAWTGAELVLTCVAQSGHLAAEIARTSKGFTIFEGTSEIQRMIIGRVVTGLDVR